MDEYTDEMYNEDKNISFWTFNRYFKKYDAYRDDLIQVSLINLFNLRKISFDESKGTYQQIAFITCKNAMLAYLTRTIKIQKFKNDISLDMTIYEDTSLEETFGEDIDHLQNLNYEWLKKKVAEIILEKKERKPNCGVISQSTKKGLYKHQIIAYEHYINGLSIPQIAKKYGISRQSVNKTIRQHQNRIQDKLLKLLNKGA